MNDFGKWLRREIDDRTMSVIAFSRRVGVSEPTLHAWLNGEHSPRGFNVVRIARALGIDRGIIDEKLGESVAA